MSEKSISEILGQGRANDDALGKVLDLILADFDCRVGTIHDWNAEKNLLRLRACRGMPEAILDKVRSIPIGKGMAGLAAQRREPVQVCNLQTDESGVAKPDARLTRMEGSIALPMLVEGELAGTLGVAKPVAYEFSPAEIERLMALGALIGRHLR